MNAGNLTIEQTESDGRRRLNLKGELDIATTADVRTAISEAQVQNDVVVVDTTELTFIDSTGLATLISARQRMGERFILVPGQTTRRLLELAGALGHFGLS